MPSSGVAASPTDASTGPSTLASSTSAFTAAAAQQHRTTATDELEELLRGLSVPWSSATLFARIARGGGAAAAAIEKLESFLHPQHLGRIGSHATQAVTLAAARVILAPVFGCRVPDDIPDPLRTALRRSITRLVGALGSNNNNHNNNNNGVSEGGSFVASPPAVPEDVACAVGVMRRFFAPADPLTADGGSGGEWLSVDDVAAHHTRWTTECLLHMFGSDNPAEEDEEVEEARRAESTTGCSSRSFRALLHLVLASVRSGSLLAEEARESVWYGLPTHAGDVDAMQQWLGVSCTQPLLRVAPRRSVSATAAGGSASVSKSGVEGERQRMGLKGSAAERNVIRDSATVARLGAELIAAERRRVAEAAAAVAAGGNEAGSASGDEGNDRDDEDGSVVRFDMLAAAAERAARDAERRAALDALYDRGSSGTSLVFVRGQLQQQQQQQQQPQHRGGRKTVEKAGTTADATVAEGKKKRGGGGASSSTATLSATAPPAAPAPVHPAGNGVGRQHTSDQAAATSRGCVPPPVALSAVEAMVRSQRRRKALHEALCIGLEQLRVECSAPSGDQ